MIGTNWCQDAGMFFHCTAGLAERNLILVQLKKRYL